MNLDDLIGEELTPGATHKTYGVASKEVRQKGADLSSLVGEELTPKTFSWDKPKPPPAEGGEFGRGLNVAWEQAKQTGYGAVGLAGAWVGNKGVRDWGLEGYERIGKEVAANAGRTDDVTNVASVGDAIDWAQYGAGYLLGQAAQTIATGGVGSLVGKVLLKKGVEVGLSRMIKADVAKRVASGAAEDVARAAALNSAAKYVGAAVGVYALNAQQEAGSIYGEAVDEAKKRGGTADDVNLARVTGSAVGAAGIDTVADMIGLGRILKGSGTGNVFGRMVRGAFAQGAIEAATEVTQTGIERWGAAREVFGEGSLGEYINAAALGALGGGAIGAIGGVRGKKADDLSTLPPADVSAVPGQNVAPESYEQQVERAYGVKLGLPDVQEAALRDLDAGLNPRQAAAQEFNPAVYWEGIYGSEQAAPAAPVDPVQASLDRAAAAPPAAQAVNEMLKETEAALSSLITRPGIYDTIQKAQRSLNDVANFRSANGEQAFMRRPDRNLAEITLPPREAPLGPGAPADPAAMEASAARMTRGLAAPQQAALDLPAPTGVQMPQPAASTASAGTQGVAPQIVAPQTAAPQTAPVAIATQPAAIAAPVAQVAQPAAAPAAQPAPVPTEAPVPPAPLGTTDDGLTVPGADYNGEPASIKFQTDGTKLTDARIVYGDGTEIGIALKKGDTFESVVARAETDGDFARQDGFVIGQPKAQQPAAKTDEKSNRQYTVRGESVDLQKRAEEEAGVKRLKDDIAKARKKSRARRALSEDAAPADRQKWANEQLAQDFKIAKSITFVETPAKWKLMAQVIEALFDQRIQFFSPVNATVNRQLEGFTLDGDPDTTYISVNTQNPFNFVAGHEFGHNISRLNPQLWKSFLEELKPLIDKKEMQDFLHRLKGQYDRMAKGGGRRVSLAEVGARAEDEIAADAIGTAFMDPQFWKMLNDSVRPEAKPLIARMMDELRAFLDNVLDLLKANALTRNSKMFKDTRALNRTVTEMLLQFSGLRDTLSYKELLVESEKFFTEKMEPDQNEASWEELGKEFQEQFAEVYDLYRMGDIDFKELETDYLRIQKAWRSNSINDELKQRIAQKYDEDMRAEARKHWDTKLHEEGEPKFDALTPEWQAYFVKQFRAWTDNQNVSLAEAYDKALDGLNIVRTEKKAEKQRLAKTAKELEARNKMVAAEVERAQAEAKKRAEQRKADEEKRAAARVEAVAKAQEKALQKTLPKAAEALQNLTPAEKKRISAFYKVKGWTEDVAKAFTREVAKLINAGDNESLIEAVPDKLRPIIWRVLRTITYSLKDSNPLDNPRFARWFGDSKRVVSLTEDERRQLEELEESGEELVGWARRDYERLRAKAEREGQPEVWYHGTSRDIDTFQPKQAHAIFLTQSMRFAEDFANYSNEWMHSSKAKAEGVRAKFFGPSIYPLYVKAEDTFDYENETHIEEVLAEVIDYMILDPKIEKEAKDFHTTADALIKSTIINMRRDISRGEWSQIESKEVQKAIRSLGFDSFYVKEAGIKNLAVYQSSQVKSVYGNRGTYNDVGRIDYSLKDDEASTPEMAQALEGLTDQERGYLTNKDGSLKDTARKFLDVFNDLPTIEEMAAVAWAGRAKRGWYTGSVRALAQVFGADAPRFAALLAAMSPQTSVESNLQNAMSVWANWVQAGRPTDKATIVKIMGRSVQQADLKHKSKDALDKIGAAFKLPRHLTKTQLLDALEALYKKSTWNRDKIRQLSVLEAWENNSVRALSSPDPAATVLSGPKVDSFYRNLVGDLQQVTNDSWMAAFAGINQTLLGGKLTEAGNPGKRPVYLALSARVRHAAMRLSQITGSNWTPAEVQETIWAWAKTLYELQDVKGEKRNAMQLLRDGALTNELIAATPDFRSLFNDSTKPYQRLLADAGLNAGRVAELLGHDTGPAAATVSGVAGKASSPFGVGQRQFEQAAAERLVARRKRKVEDGEERGNTFSLKDDEARGVNVEVAPNPDDAAVADAFAALPESVKKQATYEVAEMVIPEVLDDMGLSGTIEYTVGGFEGSSNPSIIVKFPASVPFDTMTEAGKVIGSILQQKAIISYDEADGSGTQTGFVKIVPARELSYDEQKELFARIFAVMPEAAGFTGRDGAMVFGNFTGFGDNPLTDEEFHSKLDDALAQIDMPVEAKTGLFRFRSEWVEPVTLEGTRYEGNEVSTAARGEVLRGQGRIDSLRGQAQEVLARYANQAGEPDAAQGRVTYSLKDQSPVVEVYGMAGDRVAGLASYSPADKKWTVWKAPAGQDIRDVQIAPAFVAKTPDALAALRGPGIKLVRRRASPLVEGDRTPDDFALDVENDAGTTDNAFTKAMDVLVDAANRLLATDVSGAELRKKLTRWAQDAYIDVKLVQQRIRSKGGVITGASNLYQAITLYPGSTGAQMQAFERSFAEPMEEQIEAALRKGATLPQIEDWLIARHAKERNAIIRQRTLGKNDAGSGMTDAEADRILAERPAWNAELQEIGRLTDEISKFKLKLMLDSGLIDKDTHDALSHYQHYVPLKGLDDDDTGEITADFGVGTGTAFQNKGTLLRYATGRDSKAKHVISHLLLDAEAKIVRAGKNKVAQTMLTLAEDFPDPSFWRVNEVKTRTVFDPDKGTIKLQADPDFLNQNVVVAYVNGKPQKVELLDSEFAAAMTRSSLAGNEGILNVMRRFNGWMSQMTTTYNPLWVAVNMIRDAQTAYFNIAADPKLPAGMAKQVLKNIVAMDPRSGIWELMRDPAAQNEWARLYRELEGAGGITHFFGVRTLSDRANKMREIENRVARRGLPAKAADAWRKARGPVVSQLLQDAGATIEAVPRVAAYKALIDAGWSKADAADYAKNLTVNFNKKGTQKTLTAFYLFFNPAVQGSARIWEALKSDEGKAIAGGLMVAGFIAGLTGNSAGDDDGNGIPDYQQMSDWERSTNIILWPNGPKIPLPYGWNAFYAAGNYMSDMFFGRGPGHASWKTVKAATEAFFPVDMGTSSDVAGWLVSGISPTIVDPLLQWKMNEGPFGQRIYPEDRMKGRKPDAESGRMSVGWVWREGARAMNRVTGGSATKSGAIDVNPNTLEHLFSGYMPGWPQEATKAYGFGAKMASGEETTARETPLLRKFWAEPTKTSYDDLTEAKDKLAQLAAMQKGDAEDRKELAQNYPGWLGVKLAFDQKGKRISDLYKRKAAIIDGKMKTGDPATEKKRIDDEIAKLNNELLKLFTAQKEKWAD